MRFAKPSYQFVAFDQQFSSQVWQNARDIPKYMYIICEKSLQKFYFFINTLDRW